MEVIMSVPRAVVAVVVAFASTIVAAATTTTVVDVPTRGSMMQRFLHVRPDAPVANVVVLSGGSGILNIQNDGTMTTTEARCGPVVRNRDAFAARGFALGLVDRASDGSVGVYDDVREVVRYMRSRDAVPTWIVGGSSATSPVLYLATNSPSGEPLGVIVFSPDPIAPVEASSVKRPTAIVFHPNDPAQYAAGLHAALTSAPVRQLIELRGGTSSGCGYHLFAGLDAEFVTAVSGFIAAHNASLVPGPSVGTVVEFYNASLDHYFLTHIAGEIATLDAGVSIRGWARTGQSIPVLASAQAGTSPVCRYYIPPDKGDSHFYGRGVAECEATGAANPSFVNEDPQFFHVVLPVAGACPAGTRSVYRVFSNRRDANHRYMIERSLRDTMVGRGWLAEGDGADLVVMCAPQ
jgi:hypothetical protein